MLQGGHDVHHPRVIVAGRALDAQRRPPLLAPLLVVGARRRANGERPRPKGGIMKGLVSQNDHIPAFEMNITPLIRQGSRV